MMKLKLALAVALLLSALPILAQEAATKEQKARRLLTLMKVDEVAIQMIDGMMPSLKTMAPTVPESFWAEFRKQIKGDEFIDLIVPVYTRHLEASDLDELIRFYSSPVGQRFLAKQAVILQESMAAGEQWGALIAGKASEQLQKK